MSEGGEERRSAASHAARGTRRQSAIGAIVTEKKDQNSEQGTKGGSRSA